MYFLLYLLKKKGGLKMKRIVSMLYGSYLYGTYTKDSDIDLKGIYMPSFKDFYLDRIIKEKNNSTKKSSEDRKNTKEDLDYSIYTFQYFIKLAIENQTVAIDMLHVPNSMIFQSSNLWEKIVKNREKFYSKNITTFISYVQNQASKYGIRGSKLNNAKIFLEFLENLNPESRLKEHWDQIPINEHILYIDSEKDEIKQIEVCNKKFQETSKISHIKQIIEKFIDVYGERAQQAAENKGIDWKAISHAIRILFEVKELFKDKTITFPLKEAELLKSIKLGFLDYINEVLPLLENLTDEVYKLVKKSDFPEKVDETYWENFVYKNVEKYFKTGEI